MVRGLDKFKSHFASLTDQYVLIGGTASTIAMSEVGLSFRSTQDLDIVLCVEALDSAFVRQFWKFVMTGGYEHCQRSTGKKLFYRFHSPKDTDFPKLLELFSRIPDALTLDGDPHLTPIPIGDDVSSLSAILLDDEYYAFIQQRKKVRDGLSVIDAACLIPLKARAYVDLKTLKAEGADVDSKNILKHKNDIFRLYQVLDLSLSLIISPNVRRDLKQAFEVIRQETVDLKALGIKGTTRDQVLIELEAFYGVGS